MRHFHTLIFLLLGVLLSSAQPIKAAGVVTDCSHYGPGPGTLADAIPNGGLITFACSGTIAVPGIFIETDTTIDATGQAVILTGSNTNSIFDVSNPYYYGEEGYVTVTLTLINLTLTDGYSSSNGGAIRVNDAELNLHHVTIQNSVADNHGGAIQLGDADDGGINSYGGLWMYDSKLINNEAGRRGGALYGGSASLTIERSLIADNRAGEWGGAIYGDTSMRITDSTFSGNEADRGGAIHHFAFWAGGAAVISNTTFSNNHAIGTHGQGGALFQSVTEATFYIRYSTFYGNSALEGGAIYARSDYVYLLNSLIAASTGGDCVGDEANFYITNSLATGLCGTTAPTGIDPVLSDNGGPTPTHALLPGSNALDAVPRCPPVYTDQRGNVRPADGNGDGLEVCDIGAYEAGTASGAPFRNLYRGNFYDFVLAWGPVDWAMAYEIEISSTADFSDIVANAIVPADTLSVHMADLPWVITHYRNGPHYWRVRAQRPDSTWGDWSDTDSFIIQDTDYPWYYYNN